MIFPNPFRFIAAMCQGFWYGVRGYRILTTTSEFWLRRHKCNLCPFRVEATRGDYDQCSVCTCLIDAKAALTTEKCPVGKWPRIKVKKPLTRTPSV